MSNSRFADDPIRFDVDIIEELHRWWQSTSTTVSSSQGDSVESLTKEEYAAYYQRLLYAFNNDDDDTNDIDMETAARSLEIDWHNDSGGDGEIDIWDYYDCIYELALAWAPDLDDDGMLDKDEIILYLKELFGRIFSVDWKMVQTYWNDCAGKKARIRPTGEFCTIKKAELQQTILTVQVDGSTEEQTYPLDQLILVDNNAFDSTKQAEQDWDKAAASFAEKRSRRARNRWRRSSQDIGKVVGWQKSAFQTSNLKRKTVQNLVKETKTPVSPTKEKTKVEQAQDATGKNTRSEPKQDVSEDPPHGGAAPVPSALPTLPLLTATSPPPPPPPPSAVADKEDAMQPVEAAGLRSEPLRWSDMPILPTIYVSKPAEPLQRRNISRPTTIYNESDYSGGRLLPRIYRPRPPQQLSTSRWLKKSQQPSLLHWVPNRNLRTSRTYRMRRSHIAKEPIVYKSVYKSEMAAGKLPSRFTYTSEISVSQQPIPVDLLQ